MKTNALAIGRFPRRLGVFCDCASGPNRPRRSPSALRTSKSALRPTRQHSHSVKPCQLIEERRVRLIMTHAGDVGYWPELFAVCRPIGVQRLATLHEFGQEELRRDSMALRQALE